MLGGVARVIVVSALVCCIVGNWFDCTAGRGPLTVSLFWPAYCVYG